MNQIQQEIAKALIQLSEKAEGLGPDARKRMNINKDYDEWE